MTLIRSLDPTPGQRLTLQFRHRRATCEEADCALWRDGQEFFVALRPGHPATRARSTLAYDSASGLARIIHPKGYPCGPGCPNEYCPCTNTGAIPGAGGYPHRVVDDGVPPGYRVNGAAVGESEMFDRIGEGVHAIQFVRTRGV